MATKPRMAAAEDRLTMDYPVPILNLPKSRRIIRPAGRSSAGTERKFNPAEPRVPGGEHGGEWSAGGVIKDVLKLAEKIDLGKDEKLIGSDKLIGDGGAVRLALVEHHGAKSLRIGIGRSDFGGRDDEAGPWRADPGKLAATNAERKRLHAEMDALTEEADRLDADPHADKARKAQVHARLDQLGDMDLGELTAIGHTANLDEASALRLRAALSDGIASAVKSQAASDRTLQQLDKLEAQRKPLQYMGRKWTPAEEALWDDLTAKIDALQARLDADDYEIHVEGSVPGEWADVHYLVDLDDRGIGPRVTLGAVPRGSGMSLDDLEGSESAAMFDVGEGQKLVRLLGRYLGPADAVRAASPAGTKGARQLHQYWTKGEGLAKWAESPHPWTSLYHHLVEFMSPEKAKRTAAEWFHDVFHFWPGSDKNRVLHGKPPRGDKIGPG